MSWSRRVLIPWGRLLVLVIFLLIGALDLQAEVVRMEIRQRGPFAEGHSFGHTGPYERLSGRMLVEVDPDGPFNQRVHDLKLAPRNQRGRVECWTDFFLLKPVDPCRGNRRILYDVHNRGNKLALEVFNSAPRTNDPATLADAGNGFLMRQGFSILWTGWNGDVTPDGTHRLLVKLPVARRSGKTITGKVHVEFCTSESTFSQVFFGSPWGNSDAYPTVDLDNRSAQLVMRAKRSDAPREMPRDQWAFARWENGKAIADPTSLYIAHGFRPGWLYDLVYTAKNPRVTGLGLAALRDCVSFFRYDEQDRARSGNPLVGCIEDAYIFGISQSGRLIHHFIYEGFNTDEQSRPVFGGALIHVAGAGKGMFNYRFRMTTSYSLQHEGQLEGSEFFPFAPVPLTDSLSGQRGDTLSRARASGHVPRMMFVQTSSEYWVRAASLLHTDVQGTRDQQLPKEVRVYLVAGAQHLGGGPNTKGICQQPRNTLDDRPPILRAMLVALDRWASHDVEPPPSKYPRLSEGTLVDVESYRKSFPKVAGVNLPADCYVPHCLDFGPRFLTEGIADVIPPKTRGEYRTLVPAVDADGNEVAGIRLPDVAVPLGTYTGWNLRDAQFGAEGALAGLHGMYLPFARTRDERRERNDPRPAVSERYPTRADYLARFAEATLRLHRKRYLLSEDVVRLLRIAAERWERE